MKIFALKNTLRDALIRVSGEGTATLKLEDLCYKAGRDSQKLDGAKFLQAWDYKPFRVSFSAVQWSGDDMAELRIKRGDEIIFTLVANPVGQLKFDGEFASVECTNDTEDIEFEATGGRMECWIALRKVDYRSGEEEAFFGSHDDPDKVGE